MKNINSKHCDWCGKITQKIHRRYKDEGYCINCYKTWFILKECSLCNEKARLHKKEQKPVCEKCKRRQPCIRCAKAALKDGSNTLYGRVCKSCYQNHFKQQKQCDVCFQFHRSYLQDKDDLKNIICIRCYQRKTYKSCPQCRKYRKLMMTDTGEKCKTCASNIEVNCLRCSRLMSPSCGKYCWDCYWLNKIENEAKISSYLFTSKDVKTDYYDFIGWLILNYHSNVAGMRVNKYIDFFIQCDNLWGEIPEYEQLVKYFKPFGLRKKLVVISWLCDSNRICINEELKLEIAELNRIDNLIKKFNNNLPVILDKYYKYLLDKLNDKKIVLRTVRLALQPAIGIMLKFNLKNDELINQKQVNDFLVERKGQKNTISGFIKFINKSYDLNLTYLLESTPLSKLKRKKYLEKELFKLSKLSELSPGNKSKWIVLTGEYFHNISINYKKYNIRSERNFLIISYKSIDYAIPYPF